MTEPKSEYYRRGYARAMLKLAQFAGPPTNATPRFGDATYPSLYVPRPEVAKEYADALRAYNEMQSSGTPVSSKVSARWDNARRALAEDAISSAGGNPQLEALNKELHELEIAENPDQDKIQAMRDRIAKLPRGQFRLYDDASYDAARLASAGGTLPVIRLRPGDVGVFKKDPMNPWADLSIRERVLSQAQSPDVSRGFSRSADPAEIERRRNNMRLLQQKMQARANSRKDAGSGLYKREAQNTAPVQP